MAPYPRTTKRESPRESGKGAAGGDHRRPFRRKVCKFCSDRVERIDFRDTPRLSKFTSERGKILPRRVSGTCARHQRQLAQSIKRARVLALMPFLAAG
ncbi:MAG: 30S ribosomal protein S18 [Candidatus Omnitrophica bacterium]|nr:30S ribosomal protein S18 [Candidatus Omnitrophota bacterium]